MFKIKLESRVISPDWMLLRFVVVCLFTLCSRMHDYLYCKSITMGCVTYGSWKSCLFMQVRGFKTVYKICNNFFLNLNQAKPYCDYWGFRTLEILYDLGIMVREIHQRKFLDIYEVFFHFFLIQILQLFMYGCHTNVTCIKMILLSCTGCCD